MLSRRSLLDRLPGRSADSLIAPPFLPCTPLAAGRDERPWVLETCVRTVAELAGAKEMCSQVAVTINPAFTSPAGGLAGGGWLQKGYCRLGTLCAPEAAACCPALACGRDGS